MKRILITGAGSYIGHQFALHLQENPGSFYVEEMDVRGDDWQQKSFFGYDIVMHVAGIAHQKETSKNQGQYCVINCDLTLAIAQKAKAEGIRQFVFLSTMSVYGMNIGHITKETQPAPSTAYGNSKLQAEKGLCALEDEEFRVAILRPPMVYGKGCRGNYQRLSAMVKKLPCFPRADNRRSMLYIGNLCMFLQKLAESGRGGLFFPQNKYYVSTDELARQIAMSHGKRLWQPAGFCWLFCLLAPRVGVVGKVFGSLTYDLSMSTDFLDFPQPSFEETIIATEEAG